MDFENSWAAIFQPGPAHRYFDRHAGRPFNPTLNRYDGLNAWWLAELSRLVYRQEADEIGTAASFVPRIFKTADRKWREARMVAKGRRRAPSCRSRC